MPCKKSNYKDHNAREAMIIVPVDKELKLRYQPTVSINCRHMKEPLWTSSPVKAADNCNLSQHLTTTAWKTPSGSCTANLFPNYWPSKSWMFDSTKFGDNMFAPKLIETLILRSSVGLSVWSVISLGVQFCPVSNMLCNFFYWKVNITYEKL